MSRDALVLLVLLLVLAPVTAQAVETWQRQTYNLTIETSLRDRIDTEHARVCGGRHLVNDKRLVTLARYRSTDMGLWRYFSHTDKQGRRLGDFLRAARISWRYAGENLAWNSYPDDQTARQAFLAFMGSDTHRRLIRDCHYTRIGVGSYKDSTRRIFTVLFLTPA